MQRRLRIEPFARAARSAPSAGGGQGLVFLPSILRLAATSYGSRPAEDMTIPTGFDPAAAVLFEAIVEAAYLVANADGVFDDDERRAFEGIVVEACDGSVSSQQIRALVADLGGQLRGEGLDRRVAGVASALSKKEHAREVLRVASLMAHASGGASDAEREVLSKLAAGCGLAAHEVETALGSAKAAIEDACGAGSPE